MRRLFFFLATAALGAFTSACSDSGTSGTKGTGGSDTSSANGGAGTTGSFVGSGGGSGGSTGSSGCLITCADVDANCGPISNGCGDIVDCGMCTLPDTCGGGGPNKCGTNTSCTPMDCVAQGKTCGPTGDGCGNLLQCGSCMLPETCGGDGTNSVCGLDPNCTNLCLQQVTCPGMGVTTTVSGTVFAPNGTDPLPNITVYVPNSAVMAFTPGVSCDQCADSVSGDPLVSAVTDEFGNFTIDNVPVGSNIPLVIQTGRWRRQIVIPAVAACVDNPIANGTARLPKNKNEGDIPLMAFATGDVDELECVLRKIGVEDAEFTNPSGGGRVHIYEGTGAGGQQINSSTPAESALWGTYSTLDNYDLVLFPCQGNEYTSRLTATGLQNLIDYTTAGGRVFTTHYSYVWLDGNGDFDTVAAWGPHSGSTASATGYIDMTFPKGDIMAKWLFNIGASTVLGQMPINTIRYDFTSVVAPSQLWVSLDPNLQTDPVHMTFNTPVTINGQPAPIDQQCGRVVFSGFHVEDASGNANQNFPSRCPSSNAMSPQEKMLMFMLFDLGSCITPDIPTCDPVSCIDQNLLCGPAGDGCGNVLACGDCTLPETCGGGGTPGVCGTGGCNPQDCAAQNLECGPAGDGCGNLIPSCGTCVLPQTCGGGGVSGKCGGGVPG